jgi:PST family polysaccharide transporter
MTPTSAGLVTPEAMTDAAPGRETLGRATRRAAVTGLAVQLTTQLCLLGATVILARILAPSTFGLTALANSFVGLGQLLSTAGFGAALLLRDDDIPRRASTYFWTSLGVGLFAAATISVSALYLAGLLGQPGAAPYVAALAASLPFTLATPIPQALLRRELRFRAYYGSLLVGALTYAAAQIGLALAGAGAWSVILGQLLMAVVSLLVAIALSRWRPALVFSWPLLREDLSVAGGVTTAQALVYLQKNADYFVVSATLGARSLGIYYTAFVLPTMLRQRMSWVTQTVLSAAFARVRGQMVMTRSIWRRSVLLQAGLGIPMLAGLAALAAPVIATLLGPQWQDAVPVLQIVAVLALVDLYMSTVYAVATANGFLSRDVLVQGIRAAGVALGAVVGALLGHSIIWVACAVVAASLIALLCQERLVCRPLGISVRSVAVPLLHYAVTAGLMTVVVTVAVAMTPSGPAVQLVVGTVAGAATYVGCGLLVFRSTFLALFDEGRRMVRSR